VNSFENIRFSDNFLYETRGLIGTMAQAMGAQLCIKARPLPAAAAVPATLAITRCLLQTTPQR